MCRIMYSPKRNHIKIQKNRFRKLNLEYDLIHDALKVAGIKLKIEKLRRFFSAILANSTILCLFLYDIIITYTKVAKVQNLNMIN